MLGMNPTEAESAALRRSMRSFEASDTWRSLRQLATAILPFLLLCGLMYASLSVSVLVTLALAIPAAGFLVRIFVLQHDCGHGSFFRSRRANAVTGTLCSLITWTPYLMWRRQHAGHHSHWNNLDRRLSGADIYSGCLTVDEFLCLSPMRRRLYRLVQHPLVAWCVLPPLVFLLLYRLPFDAPPTWRRERLAVYLTDLALLALYGGLGWSLGFGAMALVQVPVVVIASMAGCWLFSIQHRFERALWVRQEVWNPVSASIQGSSYLKLPRFFQWFTANIGFHHIHHLNPHIPNYRLEDCHKALPALQDIHVVTPARGWRAWRAALWDESRSRMVPFPSRTLTPR